MPRTALLTLTLLIASATVSEELPLYELGAGTVGISLPHYLGAEEEFNLLLPTPYFVYRGERFQADRAGLRTLLYGNEKLNLSISLNGSPPVDSDDNDARTDMPDLDMMLEVGPTLRYTAYQSQTGNQRLRLDLPVRAAFSSDDFSFHDQGWTSNPSIVFLSRYKRWNWSASISSIFSNRRYHGYYYDVDSPFITSQRSGYEADGGYTAARLSFSVSRRFDNIYVGSFIRYYSLDGAKNEDSPLVQKKDHFSAGFLIALILKRSEQLVTRTRDEEH